MSDDIINIALHPALLEPFKAWLASRGDLLSGPIEDGAGETFHVVCPGEEKMRLVRRFESHPCGDWPAPCNCDDPETHDGRTV